MFQPVRHSFLFSFQTYLSARARHPLYVYVFRLHLLPSGTGNPMWEGGGGCNYRTIPMGKQTNTGEMTIFCQPSEDERQLNLG